MACGHQANASCTRKDGIDYDPPVPSCVICGCIEVAPAPDLTGRVARCGYCGTERPSTERARLAFFEFCGDREHDRFYCGCRGWD